MTTAIIVRTLQGTEEEKKNLLLVPLSSSSLVVLAAAIVISVVLVAAAAARTLQVKEKKKLTGCHCCCHCWDISRTNETYLYMRSTRGILYIRYLQTYVLVSVEFESSRLVKRLSCRCLFANTNSTLTDLFSICVIVSSVRFLSLVPDCLPARAKASCCYCSLYCRWGRIQSPPLVFFSCIVLPAGAKASRSL